MGWKFIIGVSLVCLAVVFIVVLSGSRTLNEKTAVEKSPLGAAVGTSLANDAITLHYHERKPYYITSQNGVHGICATPAGIAFEAAGIPYKWRKTPARRQLEIIKRNAGRDCLLGWFKNPEREKYARYSLPIYQDRPAIALAKADNEKIDTNLTIEALLSNRELVLLRKDAYSYGEFVDRKIARYIPRQEITTSENLNMLKMIQAGRADYFFIAREEAEWAIEASYLPKTEFKFINITDMPEGNKRYLLFSFQVEPEIVEKIDHAIRANIAVME